MRKMFGAALIGLTMAGGAVMATSAQAQYYAPAPGYYDHGYYVAPAPAPAYVAPSYVAPGYYDPAAAANAAAALGAVVGGYVYQPGVPVDRYGPDPNGMIAPDGHRIKCKLHDDYDYRGHLFTRRDCY